MNTYEKPLIAVVGPTASGKTSLSIKLAKQFNAEIISADSRSFYRLTNIGTAKPDATERLEIPHHLLDVLDLGQDFSVADFKLNTDKIISDIQKRGKVPIIVGGSGLYIDSVLFNYKFGELPDYNYRAYLNCLSVEELQAIILEKAIELPENAKNKRHLIRTIELGRSLSRADTEIRSNTLVLGLNPPKEELRSRISQRTDKMLAQGLLKEVIALLEEYGRDEVMKSGNAYRAFVPHVEGLVDLNEATENNIRLDLHLAKKQRTWFKRNPHIHWIDNTSIAENYVANFLKANNSFTL